MNIEVSTIPGYRINEYKLVLVPHEDLLSKIMEVRAIFDKKLKIEKPIKSRPESILVTFKQLQMNEARIVNRLRIIAMAQPEVKIEIKNFGSFPSHSIFLNVTSKVPLTNLIKKMSGEAGRLLKLDADNKPHFFKDFYIGVVRKLNPWQYEEGWKEASNKQFTGRFIASRMLLMRKLHGESWYKPIESFDFQNLPVETKQGELFS